METKNSNMIKLTMWVNYSDIPIFINFSNVLYFHASNKGTLIVFSDNERMLVKETPEEIEALLR